MPDSSIAPSTDGIAGLTSTSSWASAEGSATTAGNSSNFTATNSTVGVYARTIAGGRGGGTTYYCNRSYFAFDVSGESGTIDSATVKIYCKDLGSAVASSLIIVGADALDGNANDHGNIFSSGTTRHSAYSSGVVIGTGASYRSFTLNSDGVTALQSAVGSGAFTCGLVSTVFDHGASTPSSTYTRSQIYYSETGGSTKDPVLEIDYEAVSANNSILFGTNF